MREDTGEKMKVKKTKETQGTQAHRTDKRDGKKITMQKTPTLTFKHPPQFQQSAVNDRTRQFLFKLL